MSAFPWDNLITAASTLVSGLGAVALKSRSDRKDRQAEAKSQDAAALTERQRTAYKCLVATATELLRSYRQTIGETEAALIEYQDAGQRSALLSRELLNAVAEVLLSGSDNARLCAKGLRDAETKVELALQMWKDGSDRVAAPRVLAEFETAVGTFIDVARE